MGAACGTRRRGRVKKSRGTPERRERRWLLDLIYRRARVIKKVEEKRCKLEVEEYLREGNKGGTQEAL
jgi:hypothetical protein